MRPADEPPEQDPTSRRNEIVIVASRDVSRTAGSVPTGFHRHVTVPLPRGPVVMSPGGVMARGTYPARTTRYPAAAAEVGTWLPRLPFAGRLWLLGGLPVGLVLMCSPTPVWVAFYTFAVFLEIGHSFSPIVFAWT